jgi:hypothetical protein
MSIPNVQKVDGRSVKIRLVVTQVLPFMPRGDHEDLQEIFRSCVEEPGKEAGTAVTKRLANYLTKC